MKAFEDIRWECDISPFENRIKVCIRRDLLTEGGEYVGKPNIAERILGITFERKLRKAIRRQLKVADKFNAAIKNAPSNKERAMKILYEEEEVRYITREDEKR